ncbi:MAG: mechanosensitive ion channel [bacterium]|nr:mechanosensitive ion channel [bacterium]
MQLLQGELQVWLFWGVMLFLAALAAFCLHFVVHRALIRLARRTDSAVDNALVRYSESPLRVMFLLVGLLLALPLVWLPAGIIGGLRHGIGLMLIATGAWLLYSLSRALDDVLAEQYRIDVADNLRARQVHTQMRVLRRVFVVLLGVVTLSVMLMTFPSVRQVGATMFASAGVAGLVVGLAARPTLANLIAGVQIALTQPIRIDDVVIVENEWGRIEEINTTFVVVRIWDLRRLVLPLSYFIEHPFQNWTRVTADVLGTVFLHTDYTVPVEEVRVELHRILDASGLWDGKVWGLQVTNTTGQTMELRALMSARDASLSWDLRCHVREKLIEFVQRRYPQSLPRVRAEIERQVVGEMAGP